MASLPSGGPCKHPPLPTKPGGPDNWVEKTGGLPHMIDCVARAIFHTGRSKGSVSKAIQLAVGACQNWADGQGNVTAQTRARATAAVAEFHAKAKASKAMTAAKNLSNDCGCGEIDLAKGAMPGGRFPIENHSDVKKAIRAVGRARSKTGKHTPEERAKVRRHIISRAKAIGATHLIPPTWQANGTLDMSVDLANFNPSEPRIAGRWSAVLGAIRKLKPGQSRSHSSGVRVIRHASGFHIHDGNRTEHAKTPGEAATKTVDAIRRKSSPKRTSSPAMALTDPKGAEVIDLATKRMQGLYNVNATVARLKNRPEFKNASPQELRRIAAARILRRQIRNKLGISDLKKLPPTQLHQLERLGLVGSRKAKVGETTSYTIQKGPRKGQTIQVRYDKSGRWREVTQRVSIGKAA